MNDLETKLTSSLRRRAQDVEATPALFEDVQRRIDRRRRWRVAAGGLAAAAVVGVVVALAVVLQQPEGAVTPEIVGEPEPPAADGAEVVPLSPSTPTRAVVTDGTSVAHVFTTGGDRQELYTPADGVEILSVAAHPDSQLSVGADPDSEMQDDLVLALVVQTTDGQVELRIIELATDRQPESHRVFTTAGADAALSAVWAQDGTYLAFAAPAGGSTLVGSTPWPPNQERPELSADLDGRVRLLDWTGTDPATTDSGLLVEQDGRIGIATLPAATSEVSGPLEVEPLDADVVVAAFAPGGTAAQRYELRDGQDGATLTAVVLDGSHQTLPLPDGLQAALEAGPVWMDGHGDGVLLGAGQQGWVVDRIAQEAVRPITGPVTHGALLAATAIDLDDLPLPDSPPPPHPQARPGTPPCPVDLTVSGQQAGDTVLLTGTAVLTADSRCGFDPSVAFRLQGSRNAQDEEAATRFFIFTEGTAAGEAQHELTPEDPTISFTARWSNWCYPATPTVVFSAANFGEATTETTPPPCQDPDQPPRLDEFQMASR